MPLVLFLCVSVTTPIHQLHVILIPDVTAILHGTEG